MAAERLSNVPKRAGRERARAMGSPALQTLAVVFFLALGSVGCSIPRAPVDDVVTSPFGMRWSGLLPEVHRGVDLRAPEGTPIQTMAAGRVRFAGWMSGYGNVVWIDHPGDVISVYGHLSQVFVVAGATIGGGDLLGLSGSTGDVTGPHLHFEVWVRGRQVDPMAYLGRRP